MITVTLKFEGEGTFVKNKSPEVPWRKHEHASLKSPSQMRGLFALFCETLVGPGDYSSLLYTTGTLPGWTAPAIGDRSQGWGLFSKPDSLCPFSFASQQSLKPTLATLYLFYCSFCSPGCGLFSP